MNNLKVQDILHQKSHFPSIIIEYKQIEVNQKKIFRKKKITALSSQIFFDM